MSLLSLPLDDDEETVRKKKPRGKKLRDKLSCLWAIPINVLNNQITGEKLKKRQGFTTYKMLSCSECKPPITFHKRSGVESHRIDIHPGSVKAAQKTRNKRLETKPLGPIRRSARLRRETDHSDVDTKMLYTSKSAKRTMLVDTDCRVEEEASIEVVWETGYSSTVENTERRRLETDSQYQPTVMVSDMINKLVRKGQGNLPNIVILDSEDSVEETLNKPSRVRNLNFDSSILRKPYVPVSALERRRDKETYVLESSDSDSDVVILDSRQG